jgi:hypothetical protein
VPIYVAITIRVFAGYTSLIGDQIKAAIADYINSLKIGDDVLLSRVYSPANLGVVSGNSRYYDITSLQIGKQRAAWRLPILISVMPKRPVAQLQISFSR